MNVYDFDNTILKGDSSALFLMHCLRKYPKIRQKAPYLLSCCVRFGLRVMEKQDFKERIFSVFMQSLSDPEAEITEFWNETERRVKAFYKEQHRPDDVVISASPEFLIKPICERLGIRYVIASPVDPKTGVFHGKNCHGAEKTVRFRQVFPEAKVEAFYSDSYSDTPMALLAEKAVLVKGEKLLPWKFK